MHAICRDMIKYHRLVLKTVCCHYLTLFFLCPNSGPCVESYLSSDLLHTPLQSPTSSEPASPVRPFVLPEGDQDEEQHLAAVASEHHGDDSDAFFTTATERQHREYLLQELRDGRQLPYNRDRPEYTFNLPLGGRDWGPQMTRIYDATCEKPDLTFQDLNDIAVLSGVLHVDEKHAHLSEDDILQIRTGCAQDVLHKAQQEEDLARAQAARGHWAAWYEVGCRPPLPLSFFLSLSKPNTYPSCL